MFECHVTLKYTTNKANLSLLDVLAERYSFRRAKLFKARSYGSGLEESDKDIFVSAKDESLLKLQKAMEDFIARLLAADLVVERYKLEAVLVDSRDHDYLYATTRKTVPSEDSSYE